MKKRLFLIVLLIAVWVGGLTATAYALDMDLVGLLTQNLGVTNQQAEGGAGAIFDAASQNMSASDFSKVTDAMPEVQSLMKAIPSSDAGSGTLGSVSSMLSKGGGSMGALAGLAGTFSKLGLGSDMVGKFMPIVLEYAQSKGGDTVASLLKAALQ